MEIPSTVKQPDQEDPRKERKDGEQGENEEEEERPQVMENGTQDERKQWFPNPNGKEW